MTFRFRALWRSTGVTFYITAETFDEAEVKAQRTVRRMMGWPSCLEIKYLGSEGGPIADDSLRLG